MPNFARMLPVLLTFAGSMIFGIEAVLAADEIAPPGDDETLVFVLREGRFTGASGKMWISVNDQTVARVKNKDYAVVRAPAGRVTVNLSTAAIPSAAIALDDRPGETVYLKWRMGDLDFREVDAEEAAAFIEKADMTDPVDEAQPNNEEVRVLINVSRLGFDLMRPAGERLMPDDESAVVTMFRRPKKEQLVFSIVGQQGYVATLEAGQAIDVRLPPGEHFFITGSIGASVFTANVEAGKQYYAWLDVGSRTQLKPLGPREAKRVANWMDGAEFVQLDPDAITPRVQERADIVNARLDLMIEDIRGGRTLGNVLSVEDAFE